MNREDLRTHRRYFDLVHGVTLQAIDVLDDGDLDYRPRDGMRSVRELVFHMYAVERSLARAVLDGELAEDATRSYTPEDPVGAEAAARLTTQGELRRFAEECHAEASEALAAVDEAALRSEVRSPYGRFDGAQFVSFINDEHWHHRGQLFVYLRLLGKKPPGLYAYGDA